MTDDGTVKLTIQVIGRHEQLQAQLGRHVDVRHVFGILVLFVVVEVFAYFLEHQAAGLIFVSIHSLQQNPVPFILSCGVDLNAIDG